MERAAVDGLACVMVEAYGSDQPGGRGALSEDDEPPLERLRVPGYVDVFGELAEWINMADRDDFSKATKTAVAMRAGHCCSFRGCGQRTVGPSDESPSSFASIGEAAHICAASPGGKRYDATMTPAARGDITNAIWMCANHARLIDRDSAIYTTEVLCRMKRDHEDACAAALLGSSGPMPSDNLIAIGPQVVCTGEFLGTTGTQWSLRLKHFVMGDFSRLATFIDSFRRFPDQDRYVLVNALGDGRVLGRAPCLTKDEGGYLVACDVAPSFPRSKAQELGSQWAISPVTKDLYIENGVLARVSGLASLPQKIQSCLSLQRGESVFAPDYGVHFAEYVEAFRGTPWLGHLLMLEIVRQSAIPYRDDVQRREFTPLQCVERVLSVEVLAEVPDEEGRMPMRCDLEVKGVGRWQCEISVCLPTLEAIRRRQKA